MKVCTVLALLFTSCFTGGGEANDEQLQCQCTDCIMDKCNPYLSAEEPYQAKDDAERILDAYLLGVPLEETLTAILFYRTKKQRMEIIKAYEDLTKLKLVEQVDGSSHLKFCDLFVALLKPLEVYFSDELNHALENKEVGIDGGSRVPEIVVNIPSCLASEVADNFRYDHTIYSLHYQIGEAFRGTTQSTLQGLAAGFRKLCDTPDVEAAKIDAQALIKSGVGRWLTNKKKFREIFTERSYPQLREILKQYHLMRTEKDANYKSIEVDLQEEFSGNTLKVFTMMTQIYIDQPRTLATWLEKAIESKMYKQIVFIVRITFDSNLADVKAAYDKEFKVKLEDKIKNSSLRRVVKDQLIAVFQVENLDEYPIM